MRIASTPILLALIAGVLGAAPVLSAEKKPAAPPKDALPASALDGLAFDLTLQRDVRAKQMPGPAGAAVPLEHAKLGFQKGKLVIEVGTVPPTEVAYIAEKRGDLVKISMAAPAPFAHVDALVAGATAKSTAVKITIEGAITDGGKRFIGSMDWKETDNGKAAPVTIFSLSGDRAGAKKAEAH